MAERAAPAEELVFEPSAAVEAAKAAGAAPLTLPGVGDSMGAVPAEVCVSLASAHCISVVLVFYCFDLTLVLLLPLHQTLMRAFLLSLAAIGRGSSLAPFCSAVSACPRLRLRLWTCLCLRHCSHTLMAPAKSNPTESLRSPKRYLARAHTRRRRRSRSRRHSRRRLSRGPTATGGAGTGARAPSRGPARAPGTGTAGRAPQPPVRVLFCAVGCHALPVASSRR
jgi:hypothetical protein